MKGKSPCVGELRVTDRQSRSRIKLDKSRFVASFTDCFPYKWINGYLSYDNIM